MKSMKDLVACVTRLIDEAFARPNTIVVTRYIPRGVAVRALANPMCIYVNVEDMRQFSDADLSNLSNYTLLGLRVRWDTVPC